MQAMNIRFLKTKKDNSKSLLNSHSLPHFPFFFVQYLLSTFISILSEKHSHTSSVSTQAFFLFNRTLHTKMRIKHFVYVWSLLLCLDKLFLTVVFFLSYIPSFLFCLLYFISASLQYTHNSVSLGLQVNNI